MWDKYDLTSLVIRDYMWICKREFLVKKKLFFLFLAVLFLNCAVYQKIEYDFAAVVPKTNSPLSTLTLDIQVFEDIRGAMPENKILFVNKQLAGVDGRSVCINSERYYEPNTVADQIATVICEHLHKKNIFKNVTLNRKEQADCFLAGKIKRFYGKQDCSKIAGTAGSMGLVWYLVEAAAIEAYEKTEGLIEIEFTDLAIFDTQGNKVKDLGDIHVRRQDYFAASSQCWCIYRNVNEQLKVAVEELADSITSNGIDLKTQETSGWAVNGASTSHPEMTSDGMVVLLSVKNIKCRNQTGSFLVFNDRIRFKSVYLTFDILLKDVVKIQSEKSWCLVTICSGSDVFDFMQFSANDISGTGTVLKKIVADNNYGIELGL
jgi:hypothetical protein